jgi:hypothetical protein
MKYLIFTSLLLFLRRTADAQSAPPAVIHERKGVDENCVYKKKYSETQRLKFFPFNVADTVMLVSFRYHRNNYPIDQHGISYDSLIEKRVLNKAEIAQLTDILYNNVAKRHGSIATLNMCFDPRNAILFIDKTGRLRAYLLICFHCDRYEASSADVDLWDPCNQKVEMIHRFFVAAGIQFGTDRTMQDYPGEDSNQ